MEDCDCAAQLERQLKKQVQDDIEAAKQSPEPPAADLCECPVLGCVVKVGAAAGCGPAHAASVLRFLLPLLNIQRVDKALCADNNIYQDALGASMRNIDSTKARIQLPKGVGAKH